jgi:hypothetical protein
VILLFYQSGMHPIAVSERLAGSCIAESVNSSSRRLIFVLLIGFSSTFSANRLLTQVVATHGQFSNCGPNHAFTSTP